MLKNANPPTGGTYRKHVQATFELYKIPHMKNLLFTPLILLFLLMNADCYAHSIRGNVTDPEGQPIVSANIILLSAKGDVLIKSTLTDNAGDFVLENIDEGTYDLKVTMLGYKSYAADDVKVDDKDLTISTIQMGLENKKLKEATVRGVRDLIEVRADKLIVNVENSIVNSGATALEVLARSPNVNVDQNDNISIKGKSGVNVMIDGKRMVVSGTDLANMLKAMPSESISKIEIISNPGAKYDAAGTAGIINIVRKRSKHMGMNGSVNVNYGQGVYPKYSAGLNLNYRSKKISSYISYNYANRQFFNGLKLDRRFYNSNDVEQFSYVQDNFLKMPIISNNASFGLDYTLSKKTVIGVAGTVGNTLLNTSANNSSMALNGAKEALYDFRTIGNSDRDYNNYSVNGNLRHNINEKGEKLSIDIDYARYTNHSEQNFDTYYTSPNGTLYQPTYYMQSDMNSITQIRSAKADYSLPLKNKTSIDVGAKVSYVTSDNEPLFYEKTTGDFTLDINRSNHFIYRENINAGYVNFNKRWDKFSLQLGLRTENTNVEAEQVTLDSLYTINYTQLFPSIAVQKSIAKNHDIGLTLSRRIQRPNYQQLNPFKFFIDNTTYKEGYPYLMPALTYSAEASHIFKKRFTTTLSYSITNDNITEVIQPSETEDSITVQTNKNLARVHYYGISGAYPIQITKWWSNVASFTAYYAHYMGNLANTNLSNGSPAITINTSNNFNLPKGFRAEVSFWYQSRQIYGFMDLKAMWMLNLGLQKNFLKNKMTVRLNAQDLFWEGLPSAFSEYEAYQESFDVKRDTRKVVLAISYRFGNQTVRPARKRRGGASDEMKRVGNAGS